ncbi:hypothetical protein D3C77_545130 [compost metagenome]
MIIGAGSHLLDHVRYLARRFRVLLRAGEQLRRSAGYGIGGVLHLLDRQLQVNDGSVDGFHHCSVLILTVHGQLLNGQIAGGNAVHRCGSGDQGSC